jgi:hypothetical protein
MIVDYLHVFGTRIRPSEHDPPLIIDTDRVLSCQIALKSFKAVAGRRVQGLKRARILCVDIASSERNETNFRLLL